MVPSLPPPVDAHLHTAPYLIVNIHNSWTTVYEEFQEIIKAPNLNSTDILNKYWQS